MVTQVYTRVQTHQVVYINYTLIDCIHYVQFFVY